MSVGCDRGGATYTATAVFTRGVSGGGVRERGGMESVREWRERERERERVSERERE